MPKISVIMPVYNSEKYLYKAVESVLNQTYTDFELFLVDDGSKDSSGAICDEFAQKDNRVTVIHKANGGLCAARNDAMDRASGEYLAFIDNDDYYDPDLLKDNYARAAADNADMVKFGRTRYTVYGDGLMEPMHNEIQNAQTLTQAEIKQQYFALREMSLFYNVWTGLYRREIAERYHIRFDPSYRFGGEDVKFCLQFLQHTQILSINPKAYYTYYKREDFSTSTKYNQNVIETQWMLGDVEYDLFEHFLGGVKPEESIPIAMQYIMKAMTLALLHKNCPLTLSEKSGFLARFKEHPLFQFGWDAETREKLKPILGVRAIPTGLFVKGQYKLLLLLTSLRWSRTTKNKRAQLAASKEKVSVV